MSDTVFLTTVIAICVAFLGAMGTVAVVLGQRIGDVVGRLDRLEARFDSFETRLDGISETLVRFDERLRRLEDHS